MTRTPRSAPVQAAPPELDAHGRLVDAPDRIFPAFRSRAHDDAAIAELLGVWHREHEHRDDPDGGVWFFASWDPFGGTKQEREPGGRFDLIRPRGTCYLGESVGVAIRERLHRFIARRVVPAGHLAGRVVTTVASPPGSGVLPELDGTVADLACADAAIFGVTGELGALSDYNLSATWAQALADSGHDAMRYLPRFTPGGGAALAVFSDAGAQPHRGGIVASIPAEQAAADIGVTVEGLPRASAARIDATIGLDDER